MSKIVDFDEFTFHYVSIKSSGSQKVKITCMYLHSTMYLLNHEQGKYYVIGLSKFTFHYVSIKSVMNDTSLIDEIKFTFHYVSIKSCVNCQ